jgi:hypothetical protein
MNASTFFKPSAAFLLLASAIAPATAGVRQSSQTVDDLTVYLGIVPAAITRGHRSEHAGEAGAGASLRSIHDIHVIAAVFSKNTGERIRNVTVSARFQGERGRAWIVPLRPMTVNDALTYGGFTSMGTNMNATVSIIVQRPSRTRRQRATVARFEYDHD